MAKTHEIQSSAIALYLNSKPETFLEQLEYDLKKNHTRFLIYNYSIYFRLAIRQTQALQLERPIYVSKGYGYLMGDPWKGAS